MNIIKPLSYVLAITLSGFAMADVKINVPDNVDLLIANGTKPKLEGGFFSSTKTLTLADGENQVVFRYQPYFDQGDDRISAESHAIVAKFSAEDKTLDFSLPKYRNANEASKNIKDLEWDFIDASGNTIDVQKDVLKKDGMQIGRNYSNEIRDYNAAGGIAAIAVTSAVPVTLPAKVSPQASANTDTMNVQGDNTAEEMLYFWYEKADAETQARFKEYVNQK